MNEPKTWEEVARCFGEKLSDHGPENYYQMPPLVWYLWATEKIDELLEYKAMYEGLCK